MWSGYETSLNSCQWHVITCGVSVTPLLVAKVLKSVCSTDQQRDITRVKQIDG